MVKILVVCTANVCRSPAAQSVLSRAFSGRDDMLITSSGTDAIQGEMADETIRALLVEGGYGSGILRHRSRVLLPHHLVEHQLVLCMERKHVERVVAMNPLLIGRCMLLSRWDNGEDVFDPTGYSRQTYVDALRLIEKLCQQWVSKLKDIGLDL